MRLIRLLKHDLAQEVSSWVDDKLISAEQARSICQRYGSDYPPPDRSSVGYNALILLGYLFLSLASITLVGANWDEIPRALRMGALVMLTLGVQGYATWRWSQGAHHSASGLYFLGNMLYGVSIILIAQIYHLGEHMPDGVFWWALGSLPFALLCRSSWLMVQTLVLATLWFFLETRMGYPAHAQFIFLACAIWILVVGGQNSLLFLFTTVSIGYWLETSLAIWWSPTNHIDFEVEHLLVGAALLVFGYASARTLQARREDKTIDYGFLLELWSLRGGLVILFALSFEGVWRELYQANWEHYRSSLIVIVVLLAAAIYQVRKSPKIIPVTTAALALFCFSALLALAPFSVEPIFLQILSNLCLVMVGIGLIVTGIQRGISHYFFTGIIVLLVTALIRYMDLVGDYIGAAALFVLFALLMLGAARFWKLQQPNRERS